MTTPIKPMSAEEAIEHAVTQYAKDACLDKLQVTTERKEFNTTMADIMIAAQKEDVRKAIRSALASHLAYVMEQLPERDTEICKECHSCYPNGYSDGYNSARADSRGVLQSEINELTQ